MSLRVDTRQAAPRRGARRASARLHLTGRDRDLLFDVESGRAHDLPAGLATAVGAALDAGDVARAEMIAAGLGILSPKPSVLAAPKAVVTRAISLAIAQKCNLGCSYCYAQQGGFGGKPKDMPDDVARQAVDRLLSTAKAGERVTVAFMGGEPLSNRLGLHAATRYAAEEAARRGIRVQFALTTNATLLSAEDIALFQEYGFTLTVSVDGIGTSHDALRPFAGGRGSFEIVSKKVRQLLATRERRYRVLARATVTPANLNLSATLSGLLSMGFDSVMFAPLLTAANGGQALQGADFEVLLDRLLDCAEMFRSEAARGRILPFSNVVRTLQRIHSYQREHYPCGAGGGYLGVSADGGFFACHRFVDDSEGYLGDTRDGVSAELQERWLVERNLQNQAPCSDCWARYLCSGSCHYEVLKAGRPACDYIRGWSDRCLRIHAELARDNPALLEQIVELA